MSIRIGGNPQPLKMPQLRFIYTKLLFKSTGQTIDGFGLNQVGYRRSQLFLNTAGGFPGLQGQPQEQLDIAAYVESFDTGMAPTVGYTRTITSTNITSSSIVSDWATLESQAAAANCSLIAEGSVNGRVGTPVYNPSLQTYVNSVSGAIYTHAQLAGLVTSGNIFTIMGPR